MIKLTSSAFFNEAKTKRELARFIMKTKQFSFGKQCETFESMFATWQGRKECMLVTSGSMANLALLQALKNLGRLKVGDAIGFSAITWSTNVMPIIQMGFIPVPIDVGINTLNVSSDTLRHALEQVTIKAMFTTNVLGFCADPDAIQHICKENNILLIEDACESLGSEYGGKKLGNFGIAATYSFYIGHQLSTIEGGAVVTDDRELSDMLRIVRAHGWDRNLTFAGKKELRKKNDVNSEFYARYAFYDLGYNMRPSEITGFLGINQLKYIDNIIAYRMKNFGYITKRLQKFKDKFQLINMDHMDKLSCFAFPILCNDERDRDAIVRKCKNTLELRPILGGNILSQPFFRKYGNLPVTVCPNAEYISSHGFYFGTNPDMTRSDLDTILTIIT